MEVFTAQVCQLLLHSMNLYLYKNVNDGYLKIFYCLLMFHLITQYLKKKNLCTKWVSLLQTPPYMNLQYPYFYCHSLPCQKHLSYLPALTKCWVWYCMWLDNFDCLWPKFNLMRIIYWLFFSISWLCLSLIICFLNGLFVP